MNRIIIDSNLLVGIIDAKDKWHTKANALAEKLQEKGWQPIYLDCVLNEVLSVIGKRLQERNEAHRFLFILNKLEEIISIKDIMWSYPYVPQYYSSILTLIKEKDGQLNFHDALIIKIAEEYSIGYIGSFDKDFDDFKFLKRIVDVKNL